MLIFYEGIIPQRRSNFDGWHDIENDFHSET